MIKTHALWVLGESLMDCVAQEDGSLLPLLGGSPFNLACAAALQGAQVGWLTPFSKDTFGQALQQRLQDCGAKPLLSSSAQATSLAVVHLTAGVPSYGFYREGVADRDYRVDDVLTLLRANSPGVLHTGSLMAVPPEIDKTLEVVQQAKQLGWTISVDVNLRPRLATDLQAYLQAVKMLAQHADWLKASDEDLYLLGHADAVFANAHLLCEHWIAQGCSRVALTFGDQGAYLRVGDAHDSSSAPRIELIDTVGAGDTFWGSCLADWLTDAQLKDNKDAQQRVSVTLQRALRAAAINCTRKGCQPPSLQELTL